MKTFKHAEGYVFDETNKVEAIGMGRYSTSDGEKYPSITRVLGATKDGSWLEDWRQSLGVEKADAESKRCADRGTAIHLLAEQYLGNQVPEVDKVSIENAKLFNQIKFDLNRINNVVGLEKNLASKTLGVAGRSDCIAEFDGVLSIIDYKTSNRFKYRENIEDYFIQATFYALAFNEMFDETIEDIVIIMAIEKDTVPMVFKEKIDNFIKPLFHRVKEFKRKQNGKK